MQNKANKLIPFIALLIACVTAFGCSVGYKDYTYSVFSSAIPLSLSILDAKAGLQNQLKSVCDEIDECVNPQKTTSDVYAFNNMKAGELRVRKTTYELVSLALDMNQKTYGAFDVTLSRLSSVWQVSADKLYTDHSAPLPQHEELSQYSSTIASIGCYTQNGEYYLTKSLDSATIDLGGIAKGYACDKMTEIAQNRCSSAIIDLGGNLMLIGKNQENGKNEKWKIGVRNPFSFGYVCGITASDSPIVTAGTYERFYKKDGVNICHIINPDTLMPVGVKQNGEGYENETGYVVSATVIASDGATSDALATAVCVLGLQRGLALLKQQNASGIIITSDHKYAIEGNVDVLMGNYPLFEMERVYE